MNYLAASYEASIISFRNSPIGEYPEPRFLLPARGRGQVFAEMTLRSPVKTGRGIKPKLIKKAPAF